MFGQFVEKRESMQTNNKMAVAPVGKLIWQMSIPPLISMFLQYSYNLIDSAFVARLNENQELSEPGKSYLEELRKYA